MKYLVSLICTISLLAGCVPDPGQVAYNDYSEYDIATLQELMQEGELSSVQLTEYYLQRIEAIDRDGPALNAIIEVNPQALEIATALDEERQASGPRGPMHGIPVVLKANIDTADEIIASPTVIPYVVADTVDKPAEMEKFHHRDHGPGFTCGFCFFIDCLDTVFVQLHILV